MDLTHRFTVPTSVEETWTHFQDLGALAECFPGATIGDYDEQSFTGTVKVKLGPIALVYTGSGTFLEKDDEAHRFVVDAKGKDKRGNGTAGAKVVLSMQEEQGATAVEVVTDLAITGKPAQFGRGVMQDVSDKLLGQFVACLEQTLAAPAEPPAPSGGNEAAAEPAPASPSAPGAAGAVPPAEARPTDVGPTAAPAGGAPGGSGGSGGSGGDDALDLGAAVVPVLAKAYWKQGVGAAALVALIVWLVSRNRS